MLSVPMMLPPATAAAKKLASKLCFVEAYYNVACVVVHTMRFTWMVYILLAVHADVNGQQDKSERDITNVEAVNIIKDYAVDIAVGPKNATYCRLEDPTGAVVFDGSSPCRLTLNRVAMEHDGIWNMNIGLPGRVLTEDVLLTVNVMEA
ncbi:uncharacterized protein LOC119191618, partial [Manduca sexta]|uniref:uncharacterized protein LOC119191618 n=1 Tax=Manduca sexta TaxID=7130 RepID=UPI00188F111B